MSERDETPVGVPDDTPHFPPHPLPPLLLGGTVNLLAGAPGVGKTALTAWLARSFRDGTPIFGHTPNPVAGLACLCADRSWQQSSRLWFEAVGFPEISHYSLRDDPNFAPSRLRKRHERHGILLTMLDKVDLPRNSLVFIDPLALFLGGNLNDYDACAVGCMELGRVCADRQLTVIGLVHAAKQKSDKGERYLRPQDRILGSTALFGFTDTQMYLASPEEMEAPTYTFVCTSHHAPPLQVDLMRDQHGLFYPVHDLPTLASTGPQATQQPTATEPPADFLPVWHTLPIAPAWMSTADLLKAFPDVPRRTMMWRLRYLDTHHFAANPEKGRWCRPTPAETALAAPADQPTQEPTDPTNS